MCYNLADITDYNYRLLQSVNRFDAAFFKLFVNRESDMLCAVIQICLNTNGTEGLTLVREICKDEAFLTQRAEAATPDDLDIAHDLLDTLAAHAAGCVGVAANMIGCRKRIIAFDNDGTYALMLNPVIIRRSGPYEAEEGCLCLTGTRKAMRYQTIKVQWQNEKFQLRLKTFTGWTAEIIQHEIDHCEGILI